MGPGCTVGGGGNFSQNRTGNKPREDQDHGLKTRFCLGGSGRESIQAMDDRRRSTVSGEEEVAGKLH